MEYCEDCGNKIDNRGICSWCDEETVIMGQYDDLYGTEFEIPYPDPESNFMKKFNEQQTRINERLRN